MLVFVTCLWHPERAKDYSKVELLLRDALASVCSQDTEDYRVIVVGHIAPHFDLPSHVEFVKVDFDPPETERRRVSRDAFRVDKGQKIAVGVAYAKHKYKAKYVALFDADDFVSNRLASHVLAQDGDSGFYIDQGYGFSYDTGQVALIPNFHRKCGTSLIFAVEDLEVPDCDPTDHEEVRRLTGEEYFSDMYGSHQRGFETFQSSSKKLRPIPFPAAVYALDTGVNHSKNKIVEAWPAFEPSAEILYEFTLPTARVRNNAYAPAEVASVSAAVGAPANNEHQSSGKSNMKSLRHTDEFKNLATVIKYLADDREIFYLKNSGNWGDRLIHEGTAQFFAQNNIEVTDIDRNTLERSLADDAFKTRFGAALFIHGGGGAWCKAWPGSKKMVTRYAEIAAHAVVLPTTFELGEVAHSNVTYFRRDQFSSVSTIKSSMFCHDMAFFYESDVQLRVPQIDKGYFYRGDAERHPDAKHEAFDFDISRLGTHISNIDPFFKILANYQLIYTDRMHVAIAAALMERECILRPGAYFKAQAVFESSIRPYYDTVKFVPWG